MLTLIRLADPPASERGAFPFDIPALRGLSEIPLPAPVTFLAGENGSGKSTLLEAVAIALRLPTIGESDAASDDSLASQRRLARTLRLVRRSGTGRDATGRGATRRVTASPGFFLRAEDFFGFIRRLGAMKSEMEARLQEVDREYEGRSELARRLARGPAAGSLAAMRSRYGDDLDANSRGESFLRLFKSRFAPGGLYLLDEPEAALSAQSQLGLIAMMSDMVSQGGQFIVATHSPILMAVPGAAIYSFDSSPLRRADYDALPGVALFRDFMSAPERYTRRLWKPPG